MKNKKTSMWRLFSGLAIVVAIGVTSCAKDGEVGAKGETGAAGPQGAPGAQGPAGPAGAPGAPGTANVIYSTWQDVTYSGVDASSPADGTIDYYVANINAPKLVDSILQKGDIKVYMNFGTTAQPQIISLPFQDLITPVFGLNNIRLEAAGNFSTATVSGSKTRQVRYILIPGGQTGRTTVNWNDYAQVKAFLNLKD